MAAGFFGAAQDAFDVYLGAEPDHVGGFGQFLTRLVPGRQRRPGVGVGEGSRGYPRPVVVLRSRRRGGYDGDMRVEGHSLGVTVRPLRC